MMTADEKRVEMLMKPLLTRSGVASYGNSLCLSSNSRECFVFSILVTCSPLVSKNAIDSAWDREFIVHSRRPNLRPCNPIFFRCFRTPRQPAVFCQTQYGHVESATPGMRRHWGTSIVSPRGR